MVSRLGFSFFFDGFGWPACFIRIRGVLALCCTVRVSRHWNSANNNNTKKKRKNARNRFTATGSATPFPLAYFSGEDGGGRPPPFLLAFHISSPLILSNEEFTESRRDSKTHTLYHPYNNENSINGKHGTHGGDDPVLWGMMLLFDNEDVGISTCAARRRLRKKDGAVFGARILNTIRSSIHRGAITEHTYL